MLKIGLRLHVRKLAPYYYNSILPTNSSYIYIYINIMYNTRILDFAIQGKIDW